MTLMGPIVALIKSGFTITVSTGCGDDHGHLHIFTSSTTQITGGTAAVGLYAQITGTGSCPTSVNASSVTLSVSAPTPAPSSSASIGPAPNPSGSPIPLPTGQTSYGSTIQRVWSGGFTLNPQTAYGLGYMHVYTGSSTVFGGGSPQAGEYAQVTGTGPVTNFHASYVGLYATAPGTVTISGTARAAAPYGFTLNVGASSSSSSSALPIVVNASTVVGGAQLVPGSKVRVVGTGAAKESVLAQQLAVGTGSPPPGSGSPTPTPPGSSSPTPTPPGSSSPTPTPPGSSSPTPPPTSGNPTPGPIAQKHVLTADYLSGSPSATSVAPYLTWAQTGSNYANAIHAAGIKTQLYVDPNRTTAGTGDPLYTSNEATFAHDCSGDRVYATYSGSVILYVMNIGNSALQSLFAGYINQQLGSGHFDAAYEDDSGPLSELVYTPFNAMPCDYSDSEWLTYGQAINQVSPIPVIFNGLDALNGHNVSMSIGLLGSSNTFGGNYEDCYSVTTEPEINNWVWQAIENTELQVNALGKTFECQLSDSASAASSYQPRIYGLASFLLTYNPSTSILWEEFSTPSGLHVLPESQLVVLDPIAPPPSSIAGLQQSGGSYGRQYGECFLAGKYVGSCAVVVNPTNNAVAFPFSKYTHTLVLNGADVLDGGTVSTNGPAPPLDLPANEAAIVFP
jgi:hypothetical protein